MSIAFNPNNVSLVTQTDLLSFVYEKLKLDDLVWKIDVFDCAERALKIRGPSDLS